MAISLNVSSPLAIANRDDLKEWIADEIDRDLSELTDKLDKWILMAEARFNRDLRCSDMEVTTTGYVTGEDTPLPVDYLAMRGVYEEGSPDQPLRATSPSSTRQEFDGTPGKPQAYVLVSGGIRLIPPPDSPILLTMDYYAKIDALSVTNPSNWLLEKHPDAYVTGVLFHYYRWSKDRNAAMDANALCESVIAKINTAAEMDRYGAGPLARATIRQTCGGRC